jgi:integrase
MKVTRNRVKGIPGLYTREYRNADRGLTVLYYGRVKSNVDGKRRLFALGSDLGEAIDRLNEIKIANRRGEDLTKFKPEKKTKPATGPATKAMTFSVWSKEYPLQEGVKDKRSLAADLGMIRLHLDPFFGSDPLPNITRRRLVEYINVREKEKTIRNGKPSKKPVARGTISNELSLLRNMLNVYNREHDDEKIVIPSFDDLIKRVQRGGRALDTDERKKVLGHYPRWLKRLAEFATETCLSEGDILRLTESMIDRKNRVIVPDGGRLKTQETTAEQAKQMAPLTDRALQIIEEIIAERRSSILAERRNSKVISISGTLFTREDGRPITRDMISRGVKRAWKKAEVKKFVFHNYRNTALTDWADRGISADVAMQAAGHTSVQMHKRYLDLQRHHIANAFGLKSGDQKMVTKNGDQECIEEKGGAASN